jgi:hypothetical protein
VVLNWTGGTAQDGYLIWRLPDGALLGPVPASATTFTDPTPPAGGTCHTIMPFTGNPPTTLGNSDVLCSFSGHRSGAAPLLFTLRANQSETGTLSWAHPPAPGRTAYLLVTIGANAPGPVILPAAATTASQPMTGPTCFVLYTVSGSTPIGNTDPICAMPGLASL